MPTTARHLITTADERTWKFDRPVLFLGEWCRLYERKSIWARMDAVVAAPYGLGQERKDADHQEARALETALFPALCEVLNRQHGSEHSPRYWRVVLGHWFRRYVDVILNRTRTLQQCLENYDLSGTTILDGACYHLATKDSYASIWAFNDDRWNHALYCRLLSLQGDKGLVLENCKDSSRQDGFHWAYAANPPSAKARLLAALYGMTGAAARIIGNEKDALIVNSYLPRKVEFKLHLLLGQLPRHSCPAGLSPEVSPDHELRRQLAQDFAGGLPGTVEVTLRELLFELLPMCYLESFPSIRESAANLPWPQTPRFIFTSNNFDTDEQFKVWVAGKIEQGTKYVAGQHGNNYGTHRHHVFPSVEEITADRFLTWGWTDGLPQHVPAFIFKTAGRKPLKWRPDGELLLIELGLPQRLNTWDVTAEFVDYFEDQQAFVRKLGSAAREQLRIRLYHSHALMRWSEEWRWRDFDKALQIDDGAQSINALISNSRLVVHSYDSTGILETLSQGVPTLAFWQNGFEHLRDSARPYYQRLVDVGVFHLSAESAAAKANEIWGNVAAWWQQQEVREAREVFCQRYARQSNAPAGRLCDILRLN